MKILEDLQVFKLCWNLLTSVSTVTGCVYISAFAPLVVIHVGITTSEAGIKLCAITAGIKKYKLIIKKKRISMIK